MKSDEINNLFYQFEGGISELEGVDCVGVLAHCSNCWISANRKTLKK